ncbi:hypothetical protein SAY86_011648 [Trapa natans]|uniref:BHLH domain-containing protein n=1 Tax=Trapa natans TaxID=22666 RepID=A0AAN7LLD5_TRANT|nr:hypothetical protein SAY86_011648 [Trapa natans]
MALKAYGANLSFGQDSFTFSDQLLCGFSGFNGFSCSGSGSAMLHPALVLDGDRGELVKAPPSATKKPVPSEKALAALRNHSEAERRRRERINSHLATLRGLVPCTDKMDKATLLAEVINQVKELKRNAVEATKGLLIPMDSDEVTIEPYEYDATAGRGGDGGFSFRASVCCEFRPTLLSEIREALEALPLKLVKAEISTVGGRLKNEFVFITCQNQNLPENCQELMDLVRRALNSVLQKFSADTSEYCPRSTSSSSKRRRIPSFDLLTTSP